MSSIAFHFAHHLSEIEVVFAIYGSLFVLSPIGMHGQPLLSPNFLSSEALVITGVMIMASSRFILNLAASRLERFA